MSKKPKIDEREVAVIDFETDPFLFGRVPAPFACGVLWRGIYAEFWGPECWRAAAEYLHSIPVPLVVYAHNGGKFDFYFMWPVLENPVRLINNRIVSVHLGMHELRDSWAIMPFPLASYKKTKIDYRKFEVEQRECHKEEILRYLRDDCTDLKELVDAFVARFGFKLTIGGTAMSELERLHPQEHMEEAHDKRFRPFYFGGRVQCFDSGILKGKWKVYDVNSMYPAVMASFDHPIGVRYVRVDSPRLTDAGWLAGYPGRMYFAEIEGIHNRALASRDAAGLRFTGSEGTDVYQVVSHELRAALESGAIEVTHVRYALIPRRVQRFEQFVDTFTAEKRDAKKRGDRINELFAKYTVNSAYGKFGQNPDNFKEYYICIRGVNSSPGVEWNLEESAPGWTLWSRPTDEKRFYDVAIAASITSAARAVLMRGLAGARRPIYCDTDSIICEGLRGVSIDDYSLGAWKLEAEGNRCAIAGKKLYALFNGREPVKWASKGTKLAPSEIERIAKGETVLWENDAPNFKLDGRVKFVARKSKRTV